MRISTDEDAYHLLNEILYNSKSTVFLGGAGVSTESGIPDFRSKNGLYNRKSRHFGKYKPEYLLSARCLKKEPAVFFSYCLEYLDCRSAMPNQAHKKLVEMEQAGCIAIAQYHHFDYGAIIYGGDDVSQDEWNTRSWDKRKGIRYNLVMLCRELVRMF